MSFTIPAEVVTARHHRRRRELHRELLAEASASHAAAIRSMSITSTSLRFDDVQRRDASRHLLTKHRLFDAFGDAVKYKVIGESTTFDDAVALASEDRYNFQFWALGLVGARPTEEKKGADKGVDGRLYFQDDPKGGTKQVIFSVKSGKLKPEYVRELTINLSSHDGNHRSHRRQLHSPKAI